MDRNLILAVVLSAVVYLGWFKLIELYYGKPADVPAATLAVPERRPLEMKAPQAEKPAPKGGLDNAVPFRVGGIAVKVQPFGGGLVSYEYPGPLGQVELVTDPFEGETPATE